MLKIEHLNFYYDESKEVLKDINLSINKNDKVAIIGRSGCGKTTLLYLLAYLYKPTSGSIYIYEQCLNSFREKTSIVFQDGGLFPWMTVYDNLKVGLIAQGFNKSQISEKINSIANELGIEELLNKFIKNLSGGQKQRVAIGRALVLNTDLLLLDEPSSSLDALTKESFQNLMRKIYQMHDLTSIIVTHDIEEAVYLANKIIIMKDGKIDEVIENELVNLDSKNTLSFYEKCIALRKKLEL